MGIPVEASEKRPTFLMPYQLDSNRGRPTLVPPLEISTAKTVAASPVEPAAPLDPPRVQNK